MSTRSKLCTPLHLCTVFFFAFFISSCATQLPPSDATDTPKVDEPAPNSPDTTSPPSAPMNSYDYLNSLRTSAGMIALGKNEALEMSAANHAQYLAENDLITHSEIPEKVGYTGATPGSRAVAVGYNTYSVGEGISTTGSELGALDDLFSAIYHRFTLLNFEFNEIGMALASANNVDSFVHNMGNSRLDSLCQTSQSVVVGRFYTGICEREIQLNASDFEAVNAFNVNLNPEYVLWPPENGRDIPPVFFEEIPDPLPDYSVSGYPVSIQFNELKTGEIIISVFRLFNLFTQQYENNTRVLDVSTDPSASFSSSEFSLFPLERLQWAAEYRAELEYSEDGISKLLNWTFTTRGVDGVLVTLSASDESINIQSGIKTFLYFEPLHGTDLISNVSSRFPSGTVVKIDFFDQNTLEVTVNGSPGDKVTLTLNNQRELSLTVSL